MGGKQVRRNRPLTYVVSVVLIALSAAEIFALFYWGGGTWLDKLGVLFALVGAYGIGVAFFAKAKALSKFRDLLESVTSPHPSDFLAGNFHFSGIALSLAATALSSRKTETAPRGLGCLGIIVWALLTPFFLVYNIVHLLILTPLAYFPTLIASAITGEIVYSARDIRVKLLTKKGAWVEVPIKEIVAGDPVAAKGFIIGVPSLVIALVGKIISVVA